MKPEKNKKRRREQSRSWAAVQRCGPSAASRFCRLSKIDKIGPAEWIALRPIDLMNPCERSQLRSCLRCNAGNERTERGTRGGVRAPLGGKPSHTCPFKRSRSRSRRVVLPKAAATEQLLEPEGSLHRIVPRYCCADLFVPPTNRLRRGPQSMESRNFLHLSLGMWL